ncbi:MAG TPA: uracil-DNA glycosylase [Actinomycetota bacterium]|nr:uracil-DNA glycosylase [Actinomycetota bacterium]
MASGAEESVKQIQAEVTGCFRCPRLVEWREASAANPPARFRGEEYWARPVPGFGDPDARLLIVGLAPAAHGGNRTGRVFTGDRSGDWLVRALHRAGFANQPISRDRSDGLRLIDSYIAAAVRCVPPDNKPLPVERRNCLPYLVREMRALRRLKVLVALGSIGWDATLAALSENGVVVPIPKPRFGHGTVAQVGGLHLIGSYHPSPQNTNTGRLSEQALDQVFLDAAQMIRRPEAGS